jgi:hypothetical protein
VSDCNLLHHIDSSPLFYRVGGHPDKLIMFILPWYTVINGPYSDKQNRWACKDLTMPDKVLTFRISV